MRKFMKLFSWEAKRMLHFPLLEIYVVLVLLVVVTEIFYVPSRGSSGSAPIMISTSSKIILLYGQKIADIVRLSTANLFVISLLTGSTLIGSYVAKELENGLTKLFFSHPINRSHIFFSKYLVCFLVLALVPFFAIVISVLILEPRFPLHFLKNGREIIALLILTSLLSLYITSVSIACSVLSRNVAMSMLGAIGILLVINIVSNDYTFLPGRSLSFIYTIFNGGDAYSDALKRAVAILFMPLVGMILSFISYYVFTRRMELS